MTPRWCEHRSELVLKTLKGYIMENTAWGRAESKTIQFLVPPVGSCVLVILGLAAVER